mmetsp:Transcript_16089/g.33055  ORF Transcript_16089/g.33055 Transcript_16089/m.33055 type:complete len:286 (-) Transcript_16089:41-898(-)
MRVPPQQDTLEERDVSSPPLRRSQILFFSTSRSDLGVTMFIAAVLCIATFVLFKLDGEVELIDSYNHDMRTATCTITAKHLQHVEIPRGPPDVDVPGQDKWRAEIAVSVAPEDGSAPFEATAHDTLQGAYDDVEDFQVHWLESFEQGQSRTCFYGLVDGEESVVFDLQAALIPDTGQAFYRPHTSYGLRVTKVVVAFFALLFAGLVVLKLLAGTWETSESFEDDTTPFLQDEPNSRRAQAQPPRYVVDLQQGSRVGEAARLDLRAGTPRSADDSIDDVSIGRSAR